MLRILVIAFSPSLLCHTASVTAGDSVAKTGETGGKSVKANSKSFLQVAVTEQSQSQSQSQMQFSAIRRNIIAEMARVDKDMIVDDNEAATSENVRSEHSHKFASLVQLGTKDIDDNNAQAAELAGLDESDIMDDEEDDDDGSSEDANNSESLVQLQTKNTDDDNLEAAQRARLVALMDKDMDTDLDDDDADTSDDSSK